MDRPLSPPPGTIEKTVNALMLLAVVAIGLGPFFVAATRQDHIERVFLPVTAAMAVLAIGLVYDASDRLLGAGKGLYSAVILCSTPVLGLAASDPGWLAATALLAVNGGALWLAVAATHDNRLPLFVLLCLLLFAGGLLLEWTGLALLFILPVYIAATQGSRVIAFLVIAMLAYVSGALLQPVVLPGTGNLLALPSMEIQVAPLVCALPWLVWLIPPILKFVVLECLFAASLLIGMLISANFSVLFVAALPGTAFLIARRFQTRMSEDGTPRDRIYDLLAGVALALAGFALSSREDADGAAHLNLAALAVVIIAVAVAFSSLRGQVRWAFGLTAVAGLLLGSSVWPSSLSGFGTEPREIDLNLGFAAGAVVALSGWIFYRRFYGAPLPRSLLRGDGHHRFDREQFLRFDRVGANGWSGARTSVDIPPSQEFSVVIFGDITGSDSLVSSRKGGYVVYRRLARTVNALNAPLAISLGDLASRAAEFPYRRLRRMLRHFRVPLAVIPGNHDVFDGAKYDLRYFHALFGADNVDFVLGDTQFILLNNAWGHVEDVQWEWLTGALQASASKIKVVCCHKPPFDPRPDTRYAMEQREHAERLHQLFRQTNVTAVFSGHIHALLHEERDGVHYVVSGGGGSRLVAEGARHHYLLLNFTAGDLTVRAIPLSPEKGEAAGASMLNLRICG